MHAPGLCGDTGVGKKMFLLPLPQGLFRFGQRPAVGWPTATAFAAYRSGDPRRRRVRRGRGGQTRMNRPLTREQTTTILQGILCLVLFVVLLQIWLLTATVNAWLGGDETILWPAAVASGICALVNFGLLRYLNR